MNVTERSIFGQFDFWRALQDRGYRAEKGRQHVVVGCGSSYNLALSVAAELNIAGVPAIGVSGNEWTVRPHAYVTDPGGAVVVTISRSGESTETVAAAIASRSRGSRVIALTCESESSLAKAADIVLAAKTHPEEGIVMTSSASLMLMLGLHLAGHSFDIANTALAAEIALNEIDAAGTSFLQNRTHLVYLGAGPFYGVMAEGALKLQEMSCTVTQYFHPLEYRHGPVSLVDSGVAVVILYHPDTLDEEAKLAAELRAKGAFVLGLGGPGDLSIALDGPAVTRGLVALPALQLLGERMAQVKGLDTTVPRHLTKVVTFAS
jgi:glucosamine--fructose-6-phosphate aminotransferase (isomerizing)